ncbi:MAG: polyprenyl synthetase family protein [Nitrospirota bacterium]
MDIKAYLEDLKNLIDTFLESVIPPSNCYPEALHNSIRYSLFAGGKRLRPILTIAAFEAVKEKSCDSRNRSLLSVASAMELIHTYSLIHDDLPAIDDDDYRRGVPTNHKVFGEAIAILAGDALLTMAFLLLSNKEYTCDVPPHRVIEIVSEISEAAGNFGMVGGQVVDIISEGKEIDFDTLHYIHTHKTGALIRASVRVGGILSEANESQMEALTTYGKSIGLAFQIADDILDIEGIDEEMGKSTGSDVAKNKKTYPAVIGIEDSKLKAEELRDTAIEAISIFGDYADPLRGIAEFVVHRRK